MHYLINFKNFSKAEINLFTNFALLIGKNGGGKSNLIEAVELLAALAEGRPLYELVEDRAYSSSSYSIRGGIHSCIKFGEDSFSLGFSGSIRFLGSNEPFDYRITVAVDPVPRVAAEYLRLGKRKIFEAETDAGKGVNILNVRFDNFARGGSKPHRVLVGDRSVISRYEELANANESGDKDKKLKAINMVSSLKRYIQSSFVFDPNPKVMRGYSRIGQNTLLKDGSNLSAVLFDLQERNAEALERVVSVIRQVPEEPFAHVEFSKTSYDVIFGLGVNGTVVDARLLSDGTLRAIAVIAALETIPEGSRVIIEEFDNGLHPSRAEVLVRAIHEIVTRRKLNVLLTTHNPASLDSLENSWLNDVSICYWSQQERTAKVTDLLKIPRIDNLLETGAGLGDLVTRSIFEKHLAPHYEEEKKAKSMEWLKSLR